MRRSCLHFLINVIFTRILNVFNDLLDVKYSQALTLYSIKHNTGLEYKLVEWSVLCGHCLVHCTQVKPASLSCCIINN